MKTLEEKIQQKKPFKSERQRAMVNLIYTSNQINDKMNRIFKEEDISMKQYNVMRIVKGASNAVSTSYIRERMLEKNSDCSRIVSRLVSKGVLKKEQNCNDARLIAIKLTKQGSEILKRMKVRMNKIPSPMESLTEKECKKLNILLNKITF